MQCLGKTKQSQRCKNKALKRCKFCTKHQKGGVGPSQDELKERVGEFIDGLIDEYFPLTSAPNWVNYPLFRREKFKTLYDNLMEHLQDTFYNYDEHELVLGYISDHVDTGTGRMHSAIDDHCEINIPEDIIRLFQEQ